MSDIGEGGGQGLTASAYAWIHITGGPLVCYPSPINSQFLAPFAESTKRAEFHDDTLAQATREINAVITRITASNDDPTRVPSLILVPGGQLMLVWAVAEHPVSPHSDPATVRETLGLPPESPAT